MVYRRYSGITESEGGITEKVCTVAGSGRILLSNDGIREHVVERYTFNPVNLKKEQKY